MHGSFAQDIEEIHGCNGHRNCSVAIVSGQVWELTGILQGASCVLYELFWMRNDGS